MERSALPSPDPDLRGAVRKSAAWLVLAIALAVLATAVDRTTTVEVFSDGGQLHVEVAGTTLSVSREIQRLTAVEIIAMDSIDPPGGLRITVSDDSGAVLDEALPHRFDFAPGRVKPVGDWEIDEGAGLSRPWQHDLDVSGAFSLEVDLRGRFLHDLTIVLEGEPTTTISIRRGLINNDFYIRRANGHDLGSTSIDPTPLADMGAIASLITRSGAVACFLVAIFGLLQAGSAPRPQPAASQPRAAALPVSALAVAAIALSGWVANTVLEALPHTPDEVVYLLQAEWLLDGRLWSEVAPFQEFLPIPFTYADGGRWLAHYPPGWPAVLAIGVAAGLPWLISPLLGGAFVVLLYLAGRELHSHALGLVAATLGVISPMARLIFGSMLSHALAATLILTALVMALRARRSRGWLNAAMAGLALGAAFGIRPLTAVAVALPLLVLALTGARPIAIHLRFGRTIAPFAGGLALAAFPTLVANQLITGSAFSFPYSLANGSMFGAANIPFGLRNLDALLSSGGAALTGWGWEWFHGPWMIALAIAPALVALITRRTRLTDWLLATMVLCAVVAYVGTRGHGMHGFGPRYHFEVLAPLFLLTARGFFVLAGRGDRVLGSEKKVPVIAAIGLFLALSLPAAIMLPKRLSLYRGYNGVNGSLENQYRDISPERALVVLATDEWQGWAEASRLLDFRPDAPVLVIQADADDPAVPTIAGERPIFIWQSGRLTPRP